MSKVEKWKSEKLQPHVDKHNGKNLEILVEFICNMGLKHIQGSQ